MADESASAKLLQVELGDLGLDRWLADEALELCEPGQSLARITAVDRGRYLVRDERREVPAELTGRFLHLAEGSDDLPCVGDWVCVRYRDAGAHEHSCRASATLVSHAESRGP